MSIYHSYQGRENQRPQRAGYILNLEKEKSHRRKGNKMLGLTLVFPSGFFFPNDTNHCKNLEMFLFKSLSHFPTEKKYKGKEGS